MRPEIAPCRFPHAVRPRGCPDKTGSIFCQLRTNRIDDAALNTGTFEVGREFLERAGNRMPLPHIAIVTGTVKVGIEDATLL